MDVFFPVDVFTMDLFTVAVLFHGRRFHSDSSWLL